MSHYTLLHRAVRPAVAVLARLGVSPDAVTGMRLATGLAASACLLAGRGPVMAIGAAIMLASMLLDRIDGALARRTGRFSRFGSSLDLGSDCVSTMALFVGLGIGVGALPGGIATVTGLALGLLAALSIAVTFLALSGQDGPGAVSRPLDPDDAMLLVPLAIWLGQAPVVLFLAAALSPVAAIVSIVLLALRRKPAPAYADSRPSRSVSTS